MDNPDLASVNSPNINSVLKPPKQRVPLKDLIAAASEEENTAARKRRVSFANVNKIKEFSAGAESMVVCQTPAYEEPFSVSSDSSYPSGVDGWTPVKGQPSVHCKPQIYPEKENIAIPSSRMSTGMDLTSVVPHSVQNTRFSVNGMDLTEVANTHEFIDQQSRFSLGMDLTNVVGHPMQNTRYSASGMDLTNVVGYPMQNTRYSASGMDLTNVVGHPMQNTRYSASGMDLTNLVGHSMQNIRHSASGMDLTSLVNPRESILDHRTRFSMGMDFTNVIGHSAQNTRYSINGMDLTEAVNPHQSFIDSDSARLSVGMDMTNVVGNFVRRRSLCNDMDLTETGDPYIYQNQDCGGGVTAMYSADDSDTLELTEAVNCAQFSVASPKHKNKDARHSLKENVLYSVNNTRNSIVSMNMSRARLSTARRKSSRYSLEGMDLTEVVNNSCDDLEFTEVIRDPSIRAGSTRNSVCALDLNEVVAGEDDTRLSADSIDCTDVVSDKLRYSADITLCSSMNLTKVTSKPDSPIHNKQNIFPNKRLKKANLPITSSKKDPVYTDSKLGVMNFCTASHESVPKVTLVHPTGEHENYCISKQVVHKSQCNIIGSEKSEVVSGEFKDKLSTSVVSESKNNGSKGSDEHEEFNMTINNSSPINLPLLQNESFVVGQKETNNVKEKGTGCMENMTPGVLEPSNEHLMNDSKIYESENKSKAFLLNISNCKTTDQEHDDFGSESPALVSGISGTEFNLYESRQIVNEAGDNAKTAKVISAQLHKSCTISSENPILSDECQGSEPLCELVNDNAIGTSVIGIIYNEEQACSVNIDDSEMALNSPKVMSDLNESFTKISMEKCSLMNESENIEHCCQKDRQNGIIEDPALNNCETNQKINIESNFVKKENHHIDKNITPKSPSIDLNLSPDSSINLSSRSLLYNQNITMTRGRSKSSIIFPETSSEISKDENSIMEDVESSSLKSTLGLLKFTDNVNKDRIYGPENNFSFTINPPKTETSCEKRGKRSFEAALEPENDTEESPNKQLCLSKDEPLEDHEILSNVTAPSFLMNTLNAPNETVPSLEQNETTAVVSEPDSPIEKKKNVIINSNSKKVSETKQEFSLRMDDSLLHSVSANPLHHEVIDLCESSFDATTTEVRELINNSRYKTKTVHHADISTKENEGFSCIVKKKGSDLGYESFYQGDLDQMSEPSLIKGLYSNKSVTKDESLTTDSDILEKEVVNKPSEVEKEVDKSSRIFMAPQLKFGSKRNTEKVRSLGNNSYVADFIPKFVEILFSIDSHGIVNNVNYQSICEGRNSAIGEYLLRQLRNQVLPVKGSDLILELQSTNKSFLARLARNLNLICKYHSGSLKGNLLTLEIASCRYHFWTLIDINIKHPQYLNPTDITISEQKVGELKLPIVRKVFSRIEKNEDQLFNFATKMTELQYGTTEIEGLC